MIILIKGLDLTQAGSLLLSSHNEMKLKYFMEIVFLNECKMLVHCKSMQIQDLLSKINLLTFSFS